MIFTCLWFWLQSFQWTTARISVHLILTKQIILSTLKRTAMHDDTHTLFLFANQTAKSVVNHKRQPLTICINHGIVFVFFPHNVLAFVQMLTFCWLKYKKKKTRNEPRLTSEIQFQIIRIIGPVYAFLFIKNVTFLSQESLILHLVPIKFSVNMFAIIVFGLNEIPFHLSISIKIKHRSILIEEWQIPERGKNTRNATLDPICTVARSARSARASEARNE